MMSVFVAMHVANPFYMYYLWCNMFLLDSDIPLLMVDMPATIHTITTLSAIYQVHS